MEAEAVAEEPGETEALPVELTRNAGNQRESHPMGGSVSRRCYVAFGSRMRSKTPISRSVSLGWILIHHSDGLHWRGQGWFIMVQWPFNYAYEPMFYHFAHTALISEFFFTGEVTLKQRVTPSFSIGVFLDITCELEVLSRYLHAYVGMPPSQ